MSRGKRDFPVQAGVIAVVLLALLGSVALFASRGDRLASRPVNERPTLMLLTSLPLVFGERISLQGGGSKVLKALEERYRVLPVAAADSLNLQGGRILFMAHAQAQPAEALVDLDGWVRGGGKLLLLADPALERQSERPLGDPLRPAPMFPDTGLLGHWGLRLDAPEERGPVQRELGGQTIVTLSPGLLHGRCAISKDRFLADCRLGKGRAVVIADADLLDVDAAGGSTEQNLDSLLATLAELEQN